MSSLQPTLPAVLDLKPTFGWLFIGVLFAGVFYGVTVVQTLFYFHTYPNDRFYLKGLVTGIWILDTLSLIMISHGTYTWLVIDFANPLGLNEVIWTIASEPLCTVTISLWVHLFMAYRIYILNHKLVLLAIVIALVSFVPFGAGIYVVVLGLSTSKGFADLKVEIHPATIVATVFAASLDIVIAATLVALLRMHGRQAYLKRTDRMISHLTIYLITNNLLTSFITTAVLIAFFAAPKTLVYLGFTVVISKAYTNTFLSQLNARQSIQGRGIISTPGSTVMRNMEPIAFGLGPISGSNAEELNFEAADLNTSGDTVQSHSTSRMSKHEKAFMK
jgi:hypothetical protein